LNPFGKGRVVFPLQVCRKIPLREHFCVFQPHRWPMTCLFTHLFGVQMRKDPFNDKNGSSNPCNYLLLEL